MRAGNCHDGVSTLMAAFPEGALKKGIVRRLSGVGPSASSFFRARSVCWGIGNESELAMYTILYSQYRHSPYHAPNPRAAYKLCTARCWTYIRIVRKFLQWKKEEYASG